jgi:serine/threonine protein kinase
MDYIPIARPISRWLKKSSGSTEIEIQSRRYSILRDSMGNEIELEGGMGIAYKCSIHSGSHGPTTGYIKHPKLDKRSESEILENLNAKNAEIIAEVNLQKRVHSIGYAPAVVGSGLFSALPEDPKFQMFIQEEAVGESFYDLKDSLTIEERLDVLENHFFPAIQTLHEHNIYHSDLDINHVFFDTSTKELEIIDWGGGVIATETEDRIKPNVGGKANYSPAEQKREDDRTYYTPQSEIYSVGAVAYYFLRDNKNGEDDSADCFGKHEQYDVYNYETKYQESIPSQVAEAIRKATMEDPLKRFQSIEELIEAWGGSQKSNLTSLVVANRDQVLSEINIENESFSHLGLDISMVGSQHNPNWSIIGEFDFFMTEGSKAGQWKTVEKLEIIDRPYIIRIDGEILLVNVQVIESYTDDVFEQEEVETDGFEEKTSGDIYIKIGTANDNRTILKNPITTSTIYVNEDEIDSRFFRI